MLVDSFGRKLDYLRVSITDRCNLRCFYCMPSQGVPLKQHNSILRFEEIIKIIKIMADLGISKVRITGGEPLVRKGIPSFFNSIKSIKGIETFSFTTNGLLLGSYLDETEVLCEDSLPNSVNISLDSLDNLRYKKITRSEDSNPEVITANIDRLLKKNVMVKINSVIIKSVNEQDILPLAALAKDKNIAVRFIELMAIGRASSKYKPVYAAEIADLIQKKYGNFTPYSDSIGSGPAVYYNLPDFKGKIGFINPVTKNFCKTCNRLRLTSDGFLKLCLANNTEIDLKKMLRGDFSEIEFINSIKEYILEKPQFHNFSDTICSSKNKHQSMSKIGG
ncbi:MAG: GTP 3',8-cyclase MoaA [Treponema sp.]|nr:GTP 3',8-cyclase MoaA [Treponema sp.]